MATAFQSDAFQNDAFQIEGAAVTGIASGTTPKATSAAAGVQTCSGTGGGTAPKATSAGTGEELFTGTMLVGTQKKQSSASGGSVYIGLGDGTQALHTGAAAAVLLFTGDGDGTQAVHTSTADGVVAANYGDASGTQALHTGEAAGDVVNPVVIAPELPGSPGGGGFKAWSSEWKNPKRIRQKVRGVAWGRARVPSCAAVGIVGITGGGAGMTVRSLSAGLGDNDTRRRRDERELIELLLMNVA